MEFNKSEKPKERTPLTEAGEYIFSDDDSAKSLRKEFADNIEQNIVHGSDAPETARVEISYFFSDSEIFS